MRNLSLLLSLAVLAASEASRAETNSKESAPSDVASLFQAAEVKMADGQYAAAADTYRKILSDLPICARAHQAAFKAALCFEAMNDPREAIAMYDRVVSIGAALLKPAHYKTNGEDLPQKGSPASAKDRIERALRSQVAACQRIGDTRKGLEAIRYLHAFAPTSASVIRMIPFQVQFEGRPAAEAEVLVRQQTEAAELYRQAQGLMGHETQETALPILERILSTYPQTAVAIHAKAGKAAILWNLKRRDQAVSLSREILEQIGQLAPDAKICRDAKWRIAWAELPDLASQAQRQVRAGQEVGDAQWEKVRAACKTIMELDPEPLHRAEAHTRLMESYCWQGRYPEALAAANDFFANYRGSRKTRDRLPKHLCWARLFKADALEHLGQPQEAALQYRSIIQWESEHPETLEGQNVVERARQRLHRLTGE